MWLVTFALCLDRDEKSSCTLLVAVARSSFAAMHTSTQHIDYVHTSGCTCYCNSWDLPKVHSLPTRPGCTWLLQLLGPAEGTHPTRWAKSIPIIRTAHALQKSCVLKKTRTLEWRQATCLGTCH